MTKTPASLRSDPLAALLHNGGRFASESLADFSGIRMQGAEEMADAFADAASGWRSFIATADEREIAVRLFDCRD